MNEYGTTVNKKTLCKTLVLNITYMIQLQGKRTILSLQYYIPFYNFLDWKCISGNVV
jgi:hypothetical protein